MRTTSRGCFKRQLTRLKISYQRARTYFRSPDVDYEVKLAYLRSLIAAHHPGEDAILFEDEVTYYNHPSTAADHSPECLQPKAALAIGGEKSWRVAGALDIFSGEFVAVQRKAIRLETFVAFLRQIASKYPKTTTIYLVLDNWPVHFHPDVVDALEAQRCPYPFFRPASWKDLQPSGRYQGENINIQLVPLPTYSPWLNPVEKVWKWLKQTIIHNHAYANNFKELKVKVEQFLLEIANRAEITLSIVGLKNPKGIFADQLRMAGYQFPEKYE